MAVIHFLAGNYRFLAAPGRPFSSGVIADEGMTLVRATFQRLRPLEEGLTAAQRHVESRGRPVTALASFELRSPRQFTQEGFDAFNTGYVERLSKLGLTCGPDQPTARTNVAPTVGTVAEPSVHAFTYTAPESDAGPAFRMSGSAETRQDGADTDKLRSIVETLSARMVELGAGWEMATAISLYCSELPPVAMGEELARSFAEGSLHGVTWYPSLPPVQGLRFELDVRRVSQELIL
jgi:hypothetical protein